jgi:aerobic-type carbon monoxide dehydrogenase small subunit (CoxS/CutS family)
MIQTQPLSLTVNGGAVGPVDVPLGMPMIDFLHDYLNLTGTRFGCGQGMCHACTVVVLEADGTTRESRTCIFGAHFFDGKSIVTIEGQAASRADGEIELTPVQQVFIDKFAFQCGYCTPGFVAGATVFIDSLRRAPVRRADLEASIEAALENHLCRCTGYVRYFEAVRDLALATPGLVVD